MGSAGDIALPTPFSHSGNLLQGVQAIPGISNNRLTFANLGQSFYLGAKTNDNKHFSAPCVAPSGDTHR